MRNSLPTFEFMPQDRCRVTIGQLETAGCNPAVIRNLRREAGMAVDVAGDDDCDSIELWELWG